MRQGSDGTIHGPGSASVLNARRWRSSSRAGRRKRRRRHVRERRHLPISPRDLRPGPGRRRPESLMAADLRTLPTHHVDARGHRPGPPGGQRRPTRAPGTKSASRSSSGATRRRPSCRPVRETLLCALTPTSTYMAVPCARGSPNRDRMMKEQGRFQVPFLRDLEHGRRAFESAAIVATSPTPTTARREHTSTTRARPRRRKTQASANTAIARRVDRRPEVVSIDTTPRRCSMPPYCIVKPWSLIWVPNADFDSE